MSCGKPHETPCSEVLAEVFLFLDGECTDARRALIKQHLDECHPCLGEYGIENDLKALIARKCGGDRAPDGLRERVKLRLTEIVVEASIEYRVEK